MEHDIIMKYPKSRNGRQCIGPCYPPKKWMIHPITLEYYTNTHFPFCPTETWIDPKNQKAYNIDECVKVSEHIDNTLIEMNIIMPKIHFTSKRFLKIYYKIYSFENTIVWINENKHKSIHTKLRILNSAWKAYGNTQNIIDEQIVNLYINLIKQYWIKKLYKYISIYVYVSGKKIYFKKQSVKNNNNYSVEKINFIIKKLITKKNIYKLLSIYIDEYTDKWDTIENHNDTLFSFMKEYFVNKIKETLY